MTDAGAHAVDPVARGLTQSDDVQLGTYGARLCVAGEWLVITRHAVGRYQERATEQARRLTPHLTLEMYLHAVAAIYTLLPEARRGWIVKDVQGQVPVLRAAGMVFVLNRMSIDSDEVIVTCYPREQRFYADEEASP